MRQTILLLVLLFSNLLLLAQQPEMDMPVDNHRHIPNRPARVYGKIVDSKSNKGVEAASVQIVATLKDKSGNVRDSLIAGTLTRPNGDFSFVNLSVPDSFTVKISAIGFRAITETVRLDPGKPGRRSLDAVDKDLGNIRIGTEAEFLGEVTVVATKPVMQMGIDRKIFNVEKSLTSTGGTAVDVMKNIPSLTVDVDGNVELRNSTPQIFVDGRPTILTLEQIPADDIERVELITNPSAKFDAASTGGIINIIMKKNKRFGLNGVVSAGVGIPEVYTGNAALNLRQGKFNFFVNGNYHHSGGEGTGEALRQNKENGVAKDYFNQHSVNDRSRRFSSLRGGVDYFIDNRNTISLTQGFVKGLFGNVETQQQEYLDNSKIMQRSGKRVSTGDANFHRSNTRFSYRHTFPTPGKEFTADVSYNSGGGGDNSYITNYFYFPDGSPYGDPNIVRNDGNDNNHQVTVQADFSNPISETAKLETGVRSYVNNYRSVYNAYSLSGGGEIKLPLSNNYKYQEQIHAAYITYTGKFKSIGYQAGLRAEYSRFDGLLIDSAKKFGYTLPDEFNSVFDGLFPSLYLSKEIGEGEEVQLNFSRRVRRPDFWQLNPFIDINDPLNISQGNPELSPEFTNSFEFNYSKIYDQGNFLASVYYRNNQLDITRYSDTITTAQFQQLNNAAIDPNAILNTFVNADHTNRVGAEFTLTQKIGEALEIIPNLNMQYRKVKAKIKDLDLSNEGLSWNSKLIFNYKLSSSSSIFNKMGFQLKGEYESGRIIPQGKEKPQYEVDVAVKKEFLKDNAASITFTVDDLFNTDRHGTIYDTDDFYQDSYRRWRVRSFRLVFSYRFGDRDFSLFKRNPEGGNDNQDRDD